MENTPDIILFWYFAMAILLLMIVLMIAAIILIKKGKRQNAKRTQILGKICLTLSGIGFAPIVLVIGYILYLYIG